MDCSRQVGFTLIELLVVVAIIGVLAAVAIPQYHEYKQRGYDTRAHTDLHNIVTAEEAYYSEYNAYKGSLPLPGMQAVSDGVQLSITLAGSQEYTGETFHSMGSREYSYDSSVGGSIMVSARSDESGGMGLGG